MQSQALDSIIRQAAKIIELLEHDREVLAAIQAQLVGETEITFGVASSDSDGTKADWLVFKAVSEQDGRVTVHLGPGSRGDAKFFLQARPDDWKAFFSSPQNLVRPYQSYWGMLRVLGPIHPEVQINVNYELKDKGWVKKLRWRH